MQKFYKSVIQFFEERVGEGKIKNSLSKLSPWDLDYGKLLIIGLLIYMDIIEIMLKFLS